MYAHHGFQNFILCLGYRGNMIKEYFLNYEAMNNDFTVCLGKKNEIDYHSRHEEQDFRVTLADTGAETMTGGRIKRIQHYIKSDTFMVTSGDGVSDVNISELMKFHQSHGNVATVTAVQPISRFGVLELNSHHVQKFAEKPQVEDYTSAGFFVFNRKMFDYIDDDPGCILEREPLEKAAQDQQLMAYKHPGFFFAMDTYREYVYLNELWNSGQAPWATWQTR